MTVAIVDTTVPIHLLRNNQAALKWIASQPKLAITPITWMEVIHGAPSKKGQKRAKNLLDESEMVYLTQTDMDWAMSQLLAHKLSHGIGILDCMIASVSYRMQLPLYTDNLKDMSVILGSKLAIRPY